MPHSHWTVVVPVKRLDDAKTRLQSTREGTAGRELALAFACDTVASVLACPSVAMVAVVTPDETVHSALPDGVRRIGEPGDEGLNAAISHACTALPPGPVAVIVSDLPSLHADELSAALDTAASNDFSFVPDSDGTGTVLLASKTPDLLRPQFGEGSASVHESAGAARLGGDWPTLRNDVDTRADLKDALAMGAGRHTVSALHAMSDDDLVHVEH